MSVQTQRIHRRKSSKHAEEIRITTTTPTIEVRVPEEHEMPSVTLSAPQLVPSPHHLGHVNVVWATWSRVAVTIDIFVSLFACFSISALNIVHNSALSPITAYPPNMSTSLHSTRCSAPPKNPRLQNIIVDIQEFILAISPSSFPVRAPYSLAQFARMVQLVEEGAPLIPLAGPSASILEREIVLAPR